MEIRVRSSWVPERRMWVGRRVDEGSVGRGEREVVGQGVGIDIRGVGEMGGGEEGGIAGESCGECIGEFGGEEGGSEGAGDLVTGTNVFRGEAFDFAGALVDVRVGGLTAARFRFGL